MTDTPKTNESNPLAKSFSLTQEQIVKAMMVLGGAFAAVCALILAVKIFKPCCRCNAMKKPCRRLQNMLMFNSILRYYMMTCLSLSVGCHR